MVKRRVPQSPRDFAALVPEEHRRQTVEKTERTERGREANREKKRIAARIDSMRAKAPDEIDTAIRTDDRKKHEEQLAASKTPQRSRRQRKADAFMQRGKRLRQRMETHVAKYTSKLKALGQNDAEPVGIPPEVWRTAELMGADGTGHMARIMLSRLPPSVARPIMKSALFPKPYKGKRKREGITLRDPSREVLDGSRRYWHSPGRRRWNHPTAIRTITIGVVLWKLSVRTRHKGFSRVTRGIPRNMIAALVQDHNTGVRPCLQTLFGNHRGTPGDVRSLEMSGLLVNQPPGAKVKARDRGPSGFAYNVYWWPPLPGEKATAPQGDAEEEIERLSEVGLRVQLGLDPPPPDTISPIGQPS